MNPTQNFYNLLHNNYVNRERDVMLVPAKDGEKALNKWIIKNAPKEYRVELLYEANLRPIWVYDQEPIFASAVDEYRSIMQRTAFCEEAKILQDVSFASLIALTHRGRTVRYPIWCHSELNSDEINELEKHFFVPCYYWYHAFLARDWFESYHRVRQLQPKNKKSNIWRFLIYARDNSGTRVYRKQLLEQIEPWKNVIKFDWDQSVDVAPDNSARISIEDAEICGIQLVAETLFDTQKIHLTEKIFKPMVMSQPFILWGPPGSLRYLKAYGFKTFNDIWSESYDEEYDATARMEALKELVKYLATIPQQQYLVMLERCQSLVEHNRQHFFSSRFQDFCWNELENNFAASCTRSTELERQHPGGQMFYNLQLNPHLLDQPSVVNTVKNFFRECSLDQRQAIINRWPAVRSL